MNPYSKWVNPFINEFRQSICMGLCVRVQQWHLRSSEHLFKCRIWMFLEEGGGGHCLSALEFIVYLRKSIIKKFRTSACYLSLFWENGHGRVLILCLETKGIRSSKENTGIEVL